MTRRRNRWLLCILGIFLITSGATLQVKAGLGTSALIAVPYVLHMITGVEMAYFNFAMFFLLTILQVPVLGKRFEKKILLQIPFGMLFAGLILLTGRLYRFTLPDSYPVRLLVVLASFVCTAVGIYLYMETNILLNATEGFVKALAIRTGYPFPSLKIAMDCLLVLIAVLLSWTFLHRVEGVREGTLLCALLVGKLMEWIPAPLKTWVRERLKEPEEGNLLNETKSERVMG